MRKAYPVDGLLLHYAGTDATPDGVMRYLSFKVEMAVDCYCGATEFEAVATHIESFVEELSLFYRNLHNTPELVCGWGDEVLFSMKLSLYNMLGPVHQECVLRQRSNGELHLCAVLDQVIDVPPVEEMIQFFKGALVDRKMTPLFIPPRR